MPAETFVDTTPRSPGREPDFKVIEPALLEGTYEFMPRVCAG